MSNILNEMIAEKQDQIILLLQAGKTGMSAEQGKVIIKLVEQTHADLNDIKQQLYKKDPFVDLVNKRSDQLEHLIKEVTVTHNHPTEKPSFFVHHWLVLTSIFLLIVCILGWKFTYKSLSELGPGDWKYRYIKVSNSHWIRGICVHTDSLYKFDPADFKDSVLAREKRLSDERVLLPFAGEKRIK
jgi:hypothetical protein